MRKSETVSLEPAPARLAESRRRRTMLQMSFWKAWKANFRSRNTPLHGAHLRTASPPTFAQSFSHGGPVASSHGRTSAGVLRALQASQPLRRSSFVSRPARLQTAVRPMNGLEHACVVTLPMEEAPISLTYALERYASYGPCQGRPGSN